MVTFTACILIEKLLIVLQTKAIVLYLGRVGF